MYSIINTNDALFVKLTDDGPRWTGVFSEAEQFERHKEAAAFVKDNTGDGQRLAIIERPLDLPTESSTKIADIRAKVDTINSWRNTEREIAGLLEGFNDDHPNRKARYSIGEPASFSLVGLLIKLEDLETVSDVAPILRELAAIGFRQKGEPDDYPELRRRTWNLKREDDPTPVKVMVFFRDTSADDADGPTCRYVQVGIKEEPIMELRCYDGDGNPVGKPEAEPVEA